MNKPINLSHVVDELQAIHDRSVANLRSGLASYLRDGVKPDAHDRLNGLFSYPELRVTYAPKGPAPRVGRAFGITREAGTYAASVARPALFRAYLIEQLELLVRDYDVEVTVGHSAQEIPYPYVLDGADDLQLDGVQTEDLARWFPHHPSCRHRRRSGGRGVRGHAGGGAALCPCSTARAWISPLARLKHYTGTPPEHVQQYVLFTNYNRYVEEFVRYGLSQLGKGRYTALSTAGRGGDGRDGGRGARHRGGPLAHQADARLPSDEPRTAPGITLVNIGVGPSNAKTICDHLAVLRPQAWLMIGHCGGLRPSQTIGDYVLAHAYLRDDHVLDDVLPVEIPIPPIAEVQQALVRGAEIVSGESGEALKRRLRTGTVVTTDDRNWELRYTLVGPTLQPVARCGDRHGKRHHRRPGLPVPRPLRHAALRVRQAPARRDQAGRDRPTSSMNRPSPST